MVELLTGELVSNAVVHGPEAGVVRIEVRIDGETVRVGVRDSGGGTPTVGHPEPTAPSGRGLALVEALSSDWGTQTHRDGKTVWFEVARRGVSAPDTPGLSGGAGSHARTPGPCSRGRGRASRWRAQSAGLRLDSARRGCAA